MEYLRLLKIVCREVIAPTVIIFDRDSPEKVPNASPGYTSSLIEETLCSRLLIMLINDYRSDSMETSSGPFQKVRTLNIHLFWSPLQLVRFCTFSR